MTRERNLGRLVGLLMLLTMAVSIAGYFVLLPPVFEGPGFLAQAGGMAGRVRAGALLALLSPTLAFAIAVACWTTFRQQGERLALALMVLAAIALAVAAVEQGLLLAMLSLSEAGGQPTARSSFAAAYAATAGARNAVHYLALFFSGATSLMLYLSLYRSRMLARFVPAIGVAAVALQLVNILLHLLGFSFQFALMAPAALCQLATGLWLIARGFRPGTERPRAHAG